MPNAIASAKSQAIDTARRWGAPVNRSDRSEGGLHWATCKAVVRREGCFTNSQGLHDFNEQLTEPVIRHVAGPWEKMFSRRLAPVLSGVSSNGSTLLTKFHNDVEARAVKNGASIAAFQMLKQQLPVYKETLKDASSTVKNEIKTKQRDINREFVPAIKDNMLAVYNICEMERGTGSFNRMKGHMDLHVESAKQSMFDESAGKVKDQLTAMLKEVKKSLMEKMDEIFMSVKRDYTGVVVGQEAGDQTQLLPREQRSLRKGVLDVVDGAELAFKRAVGLEPEEETEIAGDGANDDEFENEEATPVTAANKTEEEPIAAIEDKKLQAEEEEPVDAVKDGEPSATDAAAQATSTKVQPSQPIQEEEDPPNAFLRPNTVLSEPANEDGPEAAVETGEGPATDPSPAAGLEEESTQEHQAQPVQMPATNSQPTDNDFDSDAETTARPSRNPFPNAGAKMIRLQQENAEALRKKADEDLDMVNELMGIASTDASPHVVSTGAGPEIAQDDATDQPMANTSAGETTVVTSAVPEAPAIVESMDAKIDSTDGQADQKDNAQAESQIWSFDFDRPQGLGSDKGNNDMEAEEDEDVASTASASSGWGSSSGLGFERL